MPKAKPTQIQYLGDSVYVGYLHGMLLLWTDNGHGRENEIFLEDQVLEKLIRYLAKGA